MTPVSKLKITCHCILQISILSIIINKKKIQHTQLIQIVKAFFRLTQMHFCNYLLPRLYCANIPLLYSDHTDLILPLSSPGRSSVLHAKFFKLKSNFTLKIKFKKQYNWGYIYYIPAKALSQDLFTTTMQYLGYFSYNNNLTRQ